jgi:hypothetical protein
MTKGNEVNIDTGFPTTYVGITIRRPWLARVSNDYPRLYCLKSFISRVTGKIRLRYPVVHIYSRTTWRICLHNPY